MQAGSQKETGRPAERCILLLACAITRPGHSSRAISCIDVQLNKSMDPLGRAVDGTESTSDVVCRLFGTTITTVTRRKSPAQHICAESTDPSP